MTGADTCRRGAAHHYLTVMPANSDDGTSAGPLIAPIPSQERTFMPFRPPLCASVSRNEEKEQRLRQFVEHHIARAGDRIGEVMVVARSLDSPVVKAIVGLDQAIAAAGGTVRLILAQVDDEGQCAAGNVLSCKHAIRWARHPRLIEAHEQLVLGPTTCWIGDAMRRDPAKCDAFENYVEGCGEAAGCAAVSFGRLWFASAPLNAPTTTADAAMLASERPRLEGLPGRH